MNPPLNEIPSYLLWERETLMGFAFATRAALLPPLFGGGPEHLVF